MKHTITDSKPLYRGFFKLDAYTVEHECFDKPPITIVREHLERGDAIAVLLYDASKDQVLLIEQFRIGPAARGDSPWLIEVVAGMIDDGESPEDAAERESIEEAGFRPKKLIPLGCYYSTPGGSSERIHLFLGEIDANDAIGAGGGVASEHEDIRTFWLDRKQAVSWVESGRINSAAPMLAIQRTFGTKGLDV
ncbi:MAG: NUDIX domain-containing protein [Mariprofundaceae bacterium]